MVLVIGKETLFLPDIWEMIQLWQVAVPLGMETVD